MIACSEMFWCGQQEIITKVCRQQQNPEKKSGNQSRRTTQMDTKNLVEVQNLEEFSFLLLDNRKLPSR